MAKKLKIKTITPAEASNDKIDYVIEFMPILRRNVGIGYVTEGEATGEDFKKYPVVVRPWVDPTKF